MASQLNRKKQQLIIEKHRPGFTQLEIAKELGIDRSTVRHTVHKLAGTFTDTIHMPNTILHMMPKGISLKQHYGAR